jgi:hypothetical protein
MEATSPIQQSLARFGYAHTVPGELSDVEVAAAMLLVVRGLMIDTLFPDTKAGRAAWESVNAGTKPRPGAIAIVAKPPKKTAKKME